jgi:GTP-binding protein
MLTNHKNLAKTSGKPGKTQLINHFMVDENWYLVDLPGYGWAQVSKTQKQQWQKMIRVYLLQRSNLCLVFVLIDSRIPPQKIDMEFLKWAGEKQIPVAIILTKTDKLSKNKLNSSLKALKQALSKDWEELPEIFLSSAVDKTGKKEISQYIRSVSENFYGL